MSQNEKEKFIGFIKQLEGIRARQKALEEETTALYREASNSGVDVLALKATNQCKYSCVNDDAMFSVYRLFSKNLNRKGFQAKRTARQLETETVVDNPAR
jgi:uncharacterized protein (UPF0335 family)